MTGEKLHIVTTSRVAAVVGEMRRTPAPTIRNLRRHAAVVESIAARVPAILPARFATMVVDRDELAFILASRGTTLRRRLRALRSRCQMTVRLVSDSESGDGPLRSRSRTASRTRLRLANGATQGTQYLRQRMAMAAAARAVPRFAPIRTAVQRFVKDERVEKRGDVVTINHLIPRAAVTRYLAAVERAASDNHVRLIVSGPWAPYAFADNW